MLRLYVQDGRLINGRPDSMTGIQTSDVKKSMKRAKKISMIADGIELANMKGYYFLINSVFGF